MFPTLSLWQQILVYVLSLWQLVWKGIALWRCAKQGQRNWFIVMLVLNTVGILEIVYLFRFSKKRMKWNEIQGFFQKTFLSQEKAS